MSKEKIVSDETKEVKVSKEKYSLSDAVLRQGYKALIDGRMFTVGFDLNPQGEKVNAYASVMEEIPNPARGGGKILKWTGVTELEDLTDKQLWVLAHAKAIVMNKEQDKVFMKKFYT